MIFTQKRSLPNEKTENQTNEHKSQLARRIAGYERAPAQTTRLAQTEAFLARKRELEALAFEQICLSEKLTPFELEALLRARHAEPSEPTEEVSIDDDDHNESETA